MLQWLHGKQQKHSPHVEPPEEDEYGGEEEGGEHHPGPHREYHRHHTSNVQSNLQEKDEKI